MKAQGWWLHSHHNQLCSGHSFPALNFLPLLTPGAKLCTINGRHQTSAPFLIMAGLGCVGPGRYPSSTHSCLHLPFLVRACLPTTAVPPSHRRRASDHPPVSMTTTALDSRYSMERKEVSFTANVHESKRREMEPGGKQQNKSW